MWVRMAMAAVVMAGGAVLGQELLGPTTAPVVRAGTSATAPDGRRWTGVLEKLGSETYAVREEGQRALRGAGRCPIAQRSELSHVPGRRSCEGWPWLLRQQHVPAMRRKRQGCRTVPGVPR